MPSFQPRSSTNRVASKELRLMGIYPDDEG